jgi:hypothetical protein
MRFPLKAGRLLGSSPHQPMAGGYGALTMFV